MTCLTMRFGLYSI